MEKCIRQFDRWIQWKNMCYLKCFKQRQCVCRHVWWRRWREKQSPLREVGNVTWASIGEEKCQMVQWIHRTNVLTIG
jgi:hypothetical protein